ncbi:MAG: ornithine cyclodeaminase family protein, partial [Anaerolineales bacterium]
MLVLNAAEVRQALPMRAAIKAMKRAYAALSAGRAEVPSRTQLPIPLQEAAALFMPAYVEDDSGGVLAVKIVTLFPHNTPVGLPLIHAAVLVMDADNGRILALIEGGSLTAIRTGAGSGAATDQLARPDSRTAAILGTGVQARTQLEAICAVRPIQNARIYSPTRASVKRFIEEMSKRVEATLLPADSPQQAIADADVICAATTSTAPIFADTDLKRGAHVNGVGSYTS